MSYTKQNEKFSVVHIFSACRVILQCDLIQIRLPYFWSCLLFWTINSQALPHTPPPWRAFPRLFFSSKSIHHIFQPWYYLRGGQRERLAQRCKAVLSFPPFLYHITIDCAAFNLLFSIYVSTVVTNNLYTVDFSTMPVIFSIILT